MDFTEDHRAVALLAVTYCNAVTATENKTGQRVYELTKVVSCSVFSPRFTSTKISLDNKYCVKCTLECVYNSYPIKQLLALGPLIIVSSSSTGRLFRQRAYNYYNTKIQCRQRYCTSCKLTYSTPITVGNRPVA